VINVQGSVVNISTLPLSEEKRNIAKIMAVNNAVYHYRSFSELDFELSVRLETIKAAKALHKSGATFTTFKYSFCNPQYWELTSYGGFLLKKGVSPIAAIRDIFYNGKKYAFECATAIVIIFYKALIETLSEQVFNRLFSDILLFDWHYDQDLGIITKPGKDHIPGDCHYFNNPDFHPYLPQWRGVNVIYLENDLYFGHGIGIKNKKQMIETLNKLRKENAKKSAYLLEQTTRLNYLSLYLKNSTNYRNNIIYQIGSTTQIL
jgi:protein-glutamine gamma-glutamyltransferase